MLPSRGGVQWGDWVLHGVDGVRDRLGQLIRHQGRRHQHLLLEKGSDGGGGWEVSHEVLSQHGVIRQEIGVMHRICRGDWRG